VANGKKGSEIIVFNDAKYCPLQNEIKDENIKIQLF
jgi:hypothetical protein